MQIFVRSTPENWRKEIDGRKPNTVRVLDGDDEITVTNTTTGKSFKRKIKDITTWKDMIIISWESREK